MEFASKSPTTIESALTSFLKSVVVMVIVSVKEAPEGSWTINVIVSTPANSELGSIMAIPPSVIVTTMSSGLVAE